MADSVKRVQGKVIVNQTGSSIFETCCAEFTVLRSDWLVLSLPRLSGWLFDHRKKFQLNKYSNVMNDCLQLD